MKTVPQKHPFGDGNGFKFVGLSVNADTEVQITRGKTCRVNCIIYYGNGPVLSMFPIEKYGQTGLFPTYIYIMEIGPFGHFFNKKHMKHGPISIAYKTVNYWIFKS